MTAVRGYGTGMTPPPVESIIAWYEQRAPESLSLSTAQELPEKSEKWHANPVAKLNPLPAAYIANVCFRNVTGDETPELLAADLRSGTITLWEKPNSNRPAVRVVGQVQHPAHIEVADFDRDGLCDLLIANLGSFSAIDHNLGTVEWLRQRPDGEFENITLCDELGRVADVRAGDLDGDGDLDLVVGEFGWSLTGKTIVFENTGGSPQPKFVRRELDGRGGPVNVPLVDLNGDGRLDIVVCLGQQHETVTCFLNEGELRFTMRDLFRAPHPAWGTSGIEPVDLDQDGDLDLLVTNGDSLDDGVLKPCHGVRWLENTGELNFTPHELVSLPGAHRAQAADFDGDGDLDIVACAYAGEAAAKTPNIRELPAIVLLEQVAPGKFSPTVLERGNCVHPTLAIGDAGPAGIRFAVGDAHMYVLPGTVPSPSVAIWECGPKRPAGRRVSSR